MNIFEILKYSNFIIYFFPNFKKKIINKKIF